MKQVFDKLPMATDHPACHAKPHPWRYRLAGVIVGIVALASAFGVIHVNSAPHLGQAWAYRSTTLLMTMMLVALAGAFLFLSIYLLVEAPKQDRNRVSRLKAFCTWLVAGGTGASLHKSSSAPASDQPPEEPRPQG